MPAVPILWLVKGLDRGGAERLVTSMVPRVDRSRFAIEVAYVTPGADGFVEELAASGVRVSCLSASKAGSTGWPLQLRRLLRARGIRILHTHSPMPAALARVLGPASVAFVHTEHNLWGAYRWLTATANAVTYGRNEAVFAVSDGVAESVQRPRLLIGSMPPVETLLHGIDVDAAPRGSDARQEAREILEVADTTPLIGNVANLSPKKDHEGLLNAFRRVVTQLPDAELVLIGTGPLEPALRGQAAALGVQSNVRFLGARGDVATLLPALDVFVLGSRFEGLPIALLEAMAAEIPCVATRVGGIPEAITDGLEGVLVPPGQPDELSRALVELLIEPSRRASLAAAGRRRVAADFSIDRAVRRTEALYDELLSLDGRSADDRGGR
jgi:glycosyltransferase involved in cell wall biosynthesis